MKKAENAQPDAVRYFLRVEKIIIVFFEMCIGRDSRKKINSNKIVGGVKIRYETKAYYIALNLPWTDLKIIFRKKS